MKSTDKLFVAKLSEIGDKLENSDDLESVKKELESILDAVVSDYESAECFSSYSFENEKNMDVFAVGENIVLCKSREADREDYIKLQKENTIMPHAYEMDGFEDMMWEDMRDEKAFFTAIRRKSDDAYMGYCGIKNTQKKELELAIELLKEFHRCGYASQELKLFMDNVCKHTGITTFKALVDGENIGSQKLCEKLGGVPSGIAEHLLHDEEYMEEYERENAGKVTDLMREAAARFGVVPEKLLTHVLVYRFHV